MRVHAHHETVVRVGDQGRAVGQAFRVRRAAQPTLLRRARLAGHAEAPDDVPLAVDLDHGVGIGVGDQRVAPGQPLRRARLHQQTGRAPVLARHPVLPDDALRGEAVQRRRVRPVVGPAHLDHAMATVVVGDEDGVVGGDIRRPEGVPESVDPDIGLADDPVLPHDVLGDVVDREDARCVAVGDERVVATPTRDALGRERPQQVRVVGGPIRPRHCAAPIDDSDERAGAVALHTSVDDENVAVGQRSDAARVDGVAQTRVDRRRAVEKPGDDRLQRDRLVAPPADGDAVLGLGDRERPSGDSLAQDEGRGGARRRGDHERRRHEGQHDQEQCRAPPHGASRPSSRRAPSIGTLRSSRTT